jgi:septum site-determining protein MinD
MLVDADVDMPNLHVVAGARSEPGLASLASGNPVPEVAQSAVELPGVRVISRGTEAPADLATAFARLESRDGTVLVDTAAGASPTVADVLRVADATVVVTPPPLQSREDAAKTAARARTLDAPPVGTVFTRSDGSIDGRALLECPVLAHVPEADQPLADDRVRDAYGRARGHLARRNI